MMPGSTPASPPTRNGQTSLKSISRQKLSSVAVCDTIEQMMTSGTAMDGGNT
jgi:hypothetical protein